MSEKCFCHFNGYEVKDANARNRISSLENYVTPQMYGAKADGVTDDTEAIQTAINSSANVLIPEGNYAVHGTILLSGGKTVKLQNNCVLNKPLASGNTDPVVRIKGYYNSLVGSGMMNGRITADVATPYGVLLIGDKGMSATPEDACYNTITDVGVVGVSNGGNSSGDPVRGVYICCADGYNKAVYFNTLQNIYIGNANDGLMLEGNANANIIENIQFRGVGNDKKLSGSAIHLKRADEQHYPLENTITNVFHHESSNAVTLYLNGGVVNNAIHNIICEQGGTGAMGILMSETENKCFDNDISMIDNCYGGNIISKHFYENNTFRRRGSISSQSVRTVNLNLAKMSRTNEQHKTVERSFMIPNVKDGTNPKLFTVNIPYLQCRSLVVEITLGFGTPHLDNYMWGSHHTAKFIISGDASNKLSAKQILTQSRVSVWNDPIVNGNNVTFSAYLRYYTGTTTNNSVYCSYKIYGFDGTWSITDHTTVETVTDAVRIASCDFQTTNNGTTDGRPTAITGQQYFDKTLGKPVWYNGTAWVDATGTVV